MSLTDVDIGHPLPTPRIWTSTAIAPSATVSTYGTAQTMLPDAGKQGVENISHGEIVWGGTFGSETATLQLIPTFSDGTTGTGTTVTATATGTATLTAVNLIPLGKDGVFVTSVAVSLKSSLSAGSSLATATVTLEGAQV